MAKLKEYLKDYPNFAQAKVLELVWGLMDIQPNFMSEQLKTLLKPAGNNKKGLDP